MLKDDKSYPFIRVSVEEDFPRVMFARKSNVISRNTETLDYYNGRKSTQAEELQKSQDILDLYMFRSGT